MNPGNTLPEIKSPIVLKPLLNSGITMLVKILKKNIQIMLEICIVIFCRDS